MRTLGIVRHLDVVGIIIVGIGTSRGRAEAVLDIKDTSSGNTTPVHVRGLGAPAGGAAAAAPERGALACPSAPTSYSTRWALVTQ
jgi:hypothetical protein